MILGIISIITGAIIFIIALIKDIATVQQQTVQYLGFIWGSLFVIGGFIMITIKQTMAYYHEKNHENLNHGLLNINTKLDDIISKKPKTTDLSALEATKESIAPKEPVRASINNGVTKNIDDLMKDEEVMQHAKELRRIYGRGVYISYLKDKAKELGLGDVDMPENI